MASPQMKKISFAPIRTRRAFEVICDQIRDRLASGELKPGDRLPAERELAAKFQVSRNALREALSSLEAAGIIRCTKGAKGGAFIQSAEPDRIIQAVRDYVNLGDVTLDELTEARLAVQDIIVRLACERASDAELDALEEIVRQTEQATEVEERYHCAVAFYDTLARATGNRIFGVFVASLSAILQEFVQGPGYETLQKSLIVSRKRLLQCLRSRDCDGAAAEMEEHLGRLHRHIHKNIRRGATVSDAVRAAAGAPFSS